MISIVFQLGGVGGGREEDMRLRLGGCAIWVGYRHGCYGFNFGIFCSVGGEMYTRDRVSRRIEEEEKRRMGLGGREERRRRRA